MSLEKMVGKLIVIEGPDGVGKSTQSSLLKEYLIQKGYTVQGMHFPTHGRGFYGKLVDKYLAGEFGELSEIPPRFSASLYAGNRYENSDQIKSWLDSGCVVVLDRYVSSAMSHQGSTIADKNERLKFYDWLESLEYDLNKIPKPDMVILLDAELDTIRKSIHGRGHEDMHERDPNHLQNAINTYRELSEIYSSYWKVIRCDKSGSFRSIEDIHEDMKRASGL